MGNQNAKVSVKNSKPGLEFDEGEPKSRTNWTAGMRVRVFGFLELLRLDQAFFENSFSLLFILRLRN